MQDKKERLKDLIKLSKISTQMKLNIIIQTLSKTEDNMRAGLLSKKILSGDFNNLKQKAIDNLIEAFQETIPQSNKSTISVEEAEELNNKAQNLEKQLRELREMKEQMESLLNDTNKKYTELEYRNKELEDKNNKLISKIPTLVNSSDLIEVSDDEINELYIRYLENGETVYKDAFIRNNIIPKTYYKIEE
ncbi:hypothetical protein [Clostridium estertheticum]|uniref:hypothetical protein n=1 Tax=Clostridium estertheticum TaxID=238834 RepID=UPI001C0C54A0|nr:hypothetical protein [Clostridium estertheticum]MBU3186596.1 hypothetical protein [Clostridium estertheticum]